MTSFTFTGAQPAVAETAPEWDAQEARVVADTARPSLYQTSAGIPSL